MILKIVGAVVLIIVILITVLGIYLRAAYKHENGEWLWVSYDEGAGKRIVKLGAVDDVSFEVLSDKRYAKDRERVFLRGRAIEGADPSTFAVMSEDGYAKDDKQVFIDRTKVILAEPATFEVLSFPYARDKNRVFCGTIPLNLEGEEVGEFKVKQKLFSTSVMKIEILLSSFISQNPAYSWLDTMGIEKVIIGEGKRGETKHKVFNGFREKAK